MRSFLSKFSKKLLAFVTHVQVLSVILAFAAMVIISYYFMSNIERNHLLKNVDNAFNNTYAQIEADLMEPETTLGVIAENVRNMILRGADSDDVNEYLFNTTQYITTDRRLMAYSTFIYGFFDVFDDLFLLGTDIQPPDNYVPQERPWYTVAVNANGNVGVTDPYQNILLNVVTMTFARRIFNDEGNPLGIICLDVLLDRIMEYAINTSVTEGSYGILFDKDLNVLAHPIADRFIGVNISAMNDGVAIKEILLRGEKISERIAWDYNRNESVVFFQQINNGWYLAIMAYADKYYQSVRDIRTMLTVLGVILASSLIAILLNVVYQKKKAEERTRLMLDSVPVCANFWDKNMNIIDCNQEAVSLFDLSGKQEYIDKFFMLSPEYQPDGKSSAEKSRELIKKAFQEGYCRVDWLHQKLNGDLIPSEVIYIRVKYRNDNMVCSYTRDLREINAATDKLREADERNMLMLDGAPLGVTMWDESLNLIDFNYEAARVLGIFSKEEYLQRFAETTPEYQADGRKSKDVLIEFINTAFKEGSSHSLWNHNSVDGETIPFESMAVRLVLRDDPVVVVYCKDMRELNRANANMREADECRQALFDTTPLGCFMMNSSFNILECNNEILRLFELTDKKEYLERFFDLSPEYQPDGKLSKAKAYEYIDIAFKEGYLHFEWMHRKLNGELMPCDITLVSVMLRNEKVVCGYTRDLRDLKSVMAKMRDADDCAQIIFDATPLSCFMIDSESQILECNQEIVRLLDLKDKQDFINNVYQFFPVYQPSGKLSKDCIEKYIEEAFVDGSCCFELVHQKPNGDQIPTEVTFVRVKYRGEFAVAGYIRDLREINAMIAEMRRADIAEESNKAKSDFLAKMSHEIRTPMNAILGITEIQLQDNSIPLVTKEALERIYNSGDLLLGIINDILDLSKIEAGKLELVLGQYDIASLIHDTVKLNIMRYESKPIDFKLFVSEDIPTFLTGDELRIKQILNNLLSNAFKYTQEGQIELMFSTEKNYDTSGVKLIIRVSDTGQGMTAEQVRKLGDKFSRFNMEANRKTEGTGLGMNITRNLIALMNGDMDINSTPGMGSIFTITLPQECANPDPIGIELAGNLMQLNISNTTKIRNAQITHEFMPYGRVLVVDDVETNLYVARGLMAPYGISVDTALSGFEAIEKIRSGAVYDIIFMDHMMPRMDGIEAVKHLRNGNYNHPIVALTANAIAGQAEMFIKNGFDDFISKPIDIRQLNSMLNKMVRDKQSQEVLDEARRQKNNLYVAGNHSIAVDSQLAEIFVRDAHKVMNILNVINKNNFRREDDLSSFIINIHSMKSALANIGENDLSNKASELEQAGRDHNIKLILSALPNFINSLNKVIDKLKQSDEDTSEVDIKNLDSSDHSYLMEKILDIQEACASYNKKAAKSALADIKQKEWSRSIKTQLGTIAEFLLHSEFEEAASASMEILKLI